MNSMHSLVSRRTLLTLSVSSCLATGVACAAPVVFQDGEFNAGTWFTELYQQESGGTSQAARVTSGGNPGAALQITNTVNAGGTVIGFHRYGNTTSTRYVPSTQGEIATLDYNIDYRMINGFGQGQSFGFALKQGQVIYTAADATTGISSQWSNRPVSGLIETDFTRVDGALGHPNFTTSGEPIRFGIFTGNTSSGAGYSIVAQYDNFLVRINPPCPADFNRDGGVDGADVAAFFMAWEQGNSTADINNDGGIDGTDVEAFFVVWEAGAC